MPAVAAFLFSCVFLLCSGCQSCNRPNSGSATGSASPSSSPTAAIPASPTPSATPTVIPYSKRQFPCLSATLVGTQFDYTPDKRESVHMISAKYGVDSKVIAEINNLSTGAYVKPGQKVHIDNRHVAPCDITDGIIVNLPQRMVFLFKNGVMESSYPATVGKPDWETPVGGFRVLRMEKHPTWAVPQSIQDEMASEGKVVKESVPPGPRNPLGNYFIGLSLPGIGIHSTNRPIAIYSYKSHGCIRLQPDNARDLFNRITAGETGMVVYEPVIFAKLGDGRIFLEVDRDIYDREDDQTQAVHRLATSMGINDMVNWIIADGVAHNHDGIAHDVTAQK